MYRVDIEESIVKSNEDNISKYLITVSISLMKYLKQGEFCDPQRNWKKRHSRFIRITELKEYLKALGYKNISNKWLNEQLQIFYKSKFVQSYNSYGYTIAKRSEIFDNHSIYIQCMVNNPNSDRFKTMKFKDFIKTSAEFLYGIPQKTYIEKNNKQGSVQPIGQTLVSDYLGISQARLAQITKNNRKVFIFSEVDNKEYHASKYFKNGYVVSVNNLGEDEGEYKEKKYYKLLGTKLLTSFKYRSFIRGSTKKDPTKVVQKKLPSLSSSRLNEYKLSAPKKHSVLNKFGSLQNYNMCTMSDFEITKPYLCKDGVKNTIQIVSTKRLSAVKKLNTLVRIESFFDDIEKYHLKYKHFTPNRFYSKSLDVRFKSTYYYLLRLKNACTKEEYKSLSRTYGILKFYIEKDINRYIKYNNKRKGIEEAVIDVEDIMRILDEEEKANAIQKVKKKCEKHNSNSNNVPWEDT